MAKVLHINNSLSVRPKRTENNILLSITEDLYNEIVKAAVEEVKENLDQERMGNASVKAVKVAEDR